MTSTMTYSIGRAGCKPILARTREEARQIKHSQKRIHATVSITEIRRDYHGRVVQERRVY